ncbi:Ctr copper transporter [Phyllosticta citrichinensis]
MLWNWNTIDACFLSSSWHITSKGMFAGSCIGVILLVMALEFLRRTAKEYDRMLLRQHQRAIFASNNSSRSTMPAQSNNAAAAGGCCDGPDGDDDDSGAATAGGKAGPAATAKSLATGSFSKGFRAAASSGKTRFRPNLVQQLIRALLHMVQFAVAYFVMLLAMYFNGYIIICIFIGAFLGSFVFGWESVEVGAGAEEEVTVCCG